MAILEMATYGNPVLRKEADEVKKIDSELLKFIEDMKETLMNQNGVGLAAPQVGISKKIFIVELPQEKGTRRLVLLNPKIIFFSKHKEIAEEGCLSFRVFGEMLNVQLK